MRQLSNEEEILIIRYIDNEMSASERAIFEAQLETNPEIRNGLEIEKRLLQLGKVFNEEINSNVDELQNENRQSLDMIRALWKRRKSVNGLLAELFKPDLPPEIKPVALEEVFDYYSNGDYENVLRAIEMMDVYNLPTTRGLNDERELTIFYTHYYKGISLMAEGDFEKAIPALETALSKSTDKMSANKTRWFLALVNFEEDEVEKSEQLLNQIIMSDLEGEFKEKALKLMDRMKKK